MPDPNRQPAPDDVRAMMPNPDIPLCDDCVDAYRNGIEPGESMCELLARQEVKVP